MAPTLPRTPLARPRSRRLFVAGIAAALCVGAASPARAQQLLWSTTDGYTNSTTSESQRHVPVNFDQEVADDFFAVGQFSRVYIDGRGCGFSCTPPIVRGVYVRLYEWTPNGPGALQHQEFVTEGSPGFIHSPDPYSLDITLAAAVTVSGWHFIAVQVEFEVGGVWRPSRAYPSNPHNLPVHRRNNLAGGVWEQDRFFSTLINADISLQIWGTAAGVPEITGLSHASHDRSGRIRVFGLGFGGEQLTSRLLVDGIPAFVTQWTSATIVGYVPEGATLGDVNVVVEVGGIPSTPATLAVTARQPDGRVRWTFEFDEDLSYHRCGVAPDGTVYLNDQDARLYSLSPDGGLNWIVDTLPGEDGLGVEGPVEVGADGTVYVIADPLGPHAYLQAYNPDGTLRWQFVETYALGALAGPAIGPDGNVYAVFHSFNGGPNFGAVSLTPTGNLRWSNVGTPYLYEHGAIGTELSFGSATPGGPIDRFFVTADRDGDPWLYAFRMGDGHQIFALQPSLSSNAFQMFQAAPAAGSGQVYLGEFIGAGLGWGLQAFAGDDGDRVWRFDPGIASGMTNPSVGPDGTIYFAWDLSRVSAVSPAGVELWRHNTGGIVTEPPAFDPEQRIVLLSGKPTFGVPGWFKALDATDGNLLWTVALDPENGGNTTPDAGARFSPDGRTAYAPATLLGQPPSNQYGLLFALDTGVGLVTQYCFGDGSGALCPCGNFGAPGQGCANSADSGGASLVVSGLASVASATVALSAAGLVPSQPGLYFQGTNGTAGGSGLAFGDGLRCAGGNVLRLEIRTASGAGTSATTVDLAAQGAVVAGDVRRYQLRYRDLAGPCGSGFNLTNGVEITWAP